jgi:putative tricarboxylic transport membrane protein
LVLEGWTVLVGPKKMTPVQVAGWEQIIQKTTQNGDWKKYLTENSWENDYMNAKETAAYLKKDYERSKALLTELGMAK